MDKWLTGALALGVMVCAIGCQSGGVGDPCVPEDEYDQTTSGRGIDEVGLETRSLQCETRLCLINHFQGRVSCPYGQTDADLAKPDTDPARCRVPDSTDAVTVPVSAWNTSRPAARAVYCSCRCDGPDPGARYCECPSGFSCTSLVPDFGFGATELPGSYCVQDGTAYRRADDAAPDCRARPDDPACPGKPLVNP